MTAAAKALEMTAADDLERCFNALLGRCIWSAGGNIGGFAAKFLMGKTLDDFTKRIGKVDYIDRVMEVAQEAWLASAVQAMAAEPGSVLASDYGTLTIGEFKDAIGTEAVRLNKKGAMETLRSDIIWKLIGTKNPGSTA